MHYSFHAVANMAYVPLLQYHGERKQSHVITQRELAVDTDAGGRNGCGLPEVA